MVLNRSAGDADNIVNYRALETELIDYNTQEQTGITVKLKIDEVKKKNHIEFLSEENTRYFTVSYRLASSLLHTGIFNGKYDTKHHLYVTDGIMPTGIGWPVPKFHKS